MLGACRRIRNRGQAAHSGWPALKRDLRVPVNAASRELSQGDMGGTAHGKYITMASAHGIVDVKSEYCAGLL